MLIHEEYKGGQNLYPLPEVPKQIASLRSYIFLVPQISWAGHVSQAGFCGGVGGLDRICLSTTGISSVYPSRRANHSGILNGQWVGKADFHGYRTCSSYYCFSLLGNLKCARVCIVLPTPRSLATGGLFHFHAQWKARVF